MRTLVLVLIGLFVGALGSVAALSALRQNQPYHDTVMQVLSRQMSVLRTMRESGTCNAQEMNRRFALMHAISQEVDAAFLPVGDDDRFRRHSAAMVSALGDILAAPPQDCPMLAEAMSRTGGTCKACHDDFR